jgi:TrmH family RNA methyltransferase
MLSKNEVKYYSSLKHKKYREIEDKFLIEGFHLIEECLSSAYLMECVIKSDEINLIDFDKLNILLKHKNVPLHSLKPALFDKLTETKNSQGIIGVVKEKFQSNINELSSANLVIALDRINDPGNLGTIIRTAYWFGVDGILISNGSVDIYNSKVIRATQGAIFHVNVYQNIDLMDSLKKFSGNEYIVYLLTPYSEGSINKVKKGEKSIFVFGNESEGLSKELMNENYEKIKIPGYTNCESLNISVSCGIVMYHFKE